MKHTVIVRILSAGILATTVFAASAQTVAATVETDAATQSAGVAIEQGTHQEADRLCLRDTGTRIVARAERKQRCNVFGRVYTQDDLQRTGAVDLGDALRMLDPSIR